MIYISVTEFHQALVWDAKDVDELRRKHRIVGALCGSLPRAVRQNGHLGLPLKLLPEEATLLFEKGICRLVQYSRLNGEPSSQEVDKFNKLREESYWQQNMLFREERRRKIMEMADVIVDGKRKKLAKLKALANQDEATQGELELRPNEAEQSAVSKEEVIKKELEKIDSLVTPKDAAYVQLFTACPWLRKSEAVAAPWNFPSNDVDRLRYRVFKDLWEKGHYLTTGGKFGGDFLVYPGDPMRYHASHIAICIPYRQDFTGFDVICKGRLGTNVKKTVLMCSVNENDVVEYLSLNWTGIH